MGVAGARRRRRGAGDLRLLLPRRRRAPGRARRHRAAQLRLVRDAARAVHRARRLRRGAAPLRRARQRLPADVLALRDVRLLQDPHRARCTTGCRGGSCRSSCPARCCWRRTPRSAAGARTIAAGATSSAPPPARSVIAILAVQFWTRSAPLFGHVEYAGVIPRLEKLAQTFGDKDLVIVESRDASDVHVLALPLAYIYARNVLLLPNRRPDAATMERFIAWARQQYATVYFVGGGGTELLTQGDRGRADRHRGVPGAGVVVGVERAAGRRPAQGVRLQRLPVHRPAGRRRPAPSPSTSASTTTSTCCASTPRSGTPTAPRSAGRATCPTSTCRASPPDDRTLTLVMDDGRRPAQVPPASVEISMNDQVLGRVAVGPDFKPYAVPIPPALAAAAGVERHAGAAEARDQRLAAEGRARRARRSRSRRHGRSRGRAVAGS